MVLVHTQNHTYSHPFPTVTLAYFLRYCSPQINPFASHVLSTDTISRHVDPATGRLHTTRIHLKRSRMPSAVYKLLPSSLTGGSGDKETYVLETSIVDVKQGWMQTESRNLNFATILSVIEQQTYTAAPTATASNCDVTTKMMYSSQVGNKVREGGWFAKSIIQRSIESLASRKTQDQLGKSREGMRAVLERLRNTGVKGIVELTRKTREAALAEGGGV
ncbi:unnamed protein product [Discula destructiva]